MNIVFRREPLDGPAGTDLVAAFAAEIASLYPGWDTTIGPTAEPHEFVPPKGAFVVAYVDDRPVACGGVKLLDDNVGEIKRIYVNPDARGKGVARRLLDYLERTASELGCTMLRLDTGNNQPGALPLFEGTGYTKIADYNDNPYAAYWFEKTIASPESMS